MKMSGFRFALGVSVCLLTVKKQLEASGVRVLGAVLNKVRMKKSGYEGGYYGGYYGSYYGNYGEHHEKNA